LKDLRALTQLQRELNNAAIAVLEPNGILGYATCSPHFAETTVQVDDILKNHPEMEMINIEPYLPASLEGCIRVGALSLWTHRHGTDSMYLAILKKKS
jgi:16S rRNA (cytosine967-C5)-methyltransferase